MYQQRKETSIDAFQPSDRPWRPTVPGLVLSLTKDSPASVPAELADAYVVIDEIIDARVRMLAARWPTEGGDGRPVFAETTDILPRAFREGSLTRILNRHRRRFAQTERPLRVGDVFCVKGFTPTAPSRWAAVIDVTGAARPAARRAFLRAVAQVPETAAGEGALAPEPAAPEPEAPAPETPPSSVAHPAV